MSSFDVTGLSFWWMTGHENNEEKAAMQFRTQDETFKCPSDLIQY